MSQAEPPSEGRISVYKPTDAEDADRHVRELAERHLAKRYAEHPELREPEEAARRRYNHPGVQRRIRKIKERDFEEHTLLPSEVFAAHLRETRKSQGLGVRALADRMSRSDFPISKSQLSRIERGETPVSLDEAFALTYALQAVLANMLIPPTDKLVRLGGGFATDGPTARRWMSSGLPYRSRQKPAPELEREVRLEEAGRRLVNQVRAKAPRARRAG